MRLLYNKFSIAPMLNYTDRHCRYFMRQFSKYILLYTEMINTSKILSNPNCLYYNNKEHPLALQLGGNNPKILAKCTQIAQQYKYDEINLNIGCPSMSAKYGNFGAYLMSKKEHIITCINHMEKMTSIPITIKTRIGFDNQNSYKFLYEFIKTIFTNTSCNKFIIHARSVILNGIMNPKKNRNIPKLDYNKVYNIKRDFPNMIIIINGGINNINEAKKHLKIVDGVMIGREAYNNPNILCNVDNKIFNKKNTIINQKDIILAMLPYIEQELNNGTKLNKITRHMLGMFKGISGAKKWRYELNNNINKPNVGPEILLKALSNV